MAIPVPAGTDPACDFAEDWCATAAAINTKLAAYTQTLARVYPAVPFALLRLTEPLVIGSLVPFPFTEVVLDTAGMTDLDAEPSVITIPRSGRYTVRGWYACNTTGAVNTILNVRVSSNTTSPLTEVNGTILDRNNFSPMGNGAYQSVSTINSGTKMQLLQASGVSLTVTSASLCIAWHSDMERPS